MRDILGERDANVPDVPTRVAEPSREESLPKRFFKDVATEQRDNVWVILLDGRTVKTPGKNLLSVKDFGLAKKIAVEWDDQAVRIDPMTMPLTRLLNTALDGVAGDMQAVKEDIVRYAGTDMLCYRAGAPEGLVAQQTEAWDPWIDWAQTVLGCRFVLAEGVMHVAQPPESLAAFGVHVGAINDPLVLAATHVVTSLTGSATLALALQKGAIEWEELWRIAHLDEDWNISQWGEDEEATVLRESKYRDMKAACQVISALT